jgi:hypothetical protein
MSTECTLEIQCSVCDKKSIINFTSIDRLKEFYEDRSVIDMHTTYAGSEESWICTECNNKLKDLIEKSRSELKEVVNNFLRITP